MAKRCDMPEGESLQPGDTRADWPTECEDPECATTEHCGLAIGCSVCGSRKVSASYFVLTGRLGLSCEDCQVPIALFQVAAGGVTVS